MKEIILCVLGGGIGAAAIKVIESIITWKLNRKATLEDRAEAKKETKEAEAQKAVSELKTEVAGLRAGERIILHDRIKFLGRSYVRAGRVDFDDRQDLIDMHSVYHNALGGNGNLDSLMAEVMELPCD